MERQVKERLVGAAVLMAAAVILIPEMLSGPDREFAEFADETPNGAPLKTYTIDLSQPAGAALAGERPEDRAPVSVQPMDLQPKAPPQPAQAEPETAVSNTAAARATTEQSSALSAQSPAARAPGQDSASARATAPQSALPQSASPQSPSLKSPSQNSTAPKSVERPAADVVGSPTPSRVTAPPAGGPANVAPKPSAPSSGAWAVQIGSYSRRDSAESQAARLRAAGHSAFVMPVRTQAGTMHRVRVGPMKDRAAAESSLRVLRNVAPDAAVVPHP